MNLLYVSLGNLFGVHIPAQYVDLVQSTIRRLSNFCPHEHNVRLQSLGLH